LRNSGNTTAFRKLAQIRKKLPEMRNIPENRK